MVVKAKPKFKKPRNEKPSVIALGFDLSPASLSGCAQLWDGPMTKLKGPVWFRAPWTKEVAHFEKLKQLARAELFVQKLVYDLNAIVDLSYVYIGVEDLPPRAMNAQRYREQAELIGAFLGGLLRWGYPNISLVNAKSWRAMVANDLERKANNDFTKWDVKEWAIELGAPRWKDLIYNSKRGLIPKPKKSTAKATQPDDRYDSMGIMTWIWDTQIPSKLIR